MPTEQYSVNQHSVQTLLTWIESEEIAIPEIQRPFVWDATKVRDFIDSLYRGYPVGYLIAWRNPAVRLKDGKQSAGKRILIDGQQRVTAILAALLGQEVVTKNYTKTRIRIAFQPDEQSFQVSNAAIRKDRSYIKDIAELFEPGAKLLRIVDAYCNENNDSDRDTIYEHIERLRGVQNNLLGLIELNGSLDVETVSEIFVRINSQGVPLNAADFAMSKLAANEKHNGHQLRKCIDYFCRLAIAPEDYTEISQDREFSESSYFRALAWLKNEKEDLYNPTCTDMLRVAFTAGFGRGKLVDLVALLSGRNFETRQFEERVVEKSFNTLDTSVRRFMNENDFKRFVMILRSAGFVSASMIRSQNVVNFAYVLYLRLRKQRVQSVLIEQLVRRWFVMSILTHRYAGSPETAFGKDIRKIIEGCAENYLEDVERANLSDAFWNAGLPQKLNSSAPRSPYFNVFLASQVTANNNGFLSTALTVQTLLEGTYHFHHVFPKHFLRKCGFPPGRINQIANLVLMQGEVNIALGSRSPIEYFQMLKQQCQTGKPILGGITDSGVLSQSLKDHCIPDEVHNMGTEHYGAFLHQRRLLMAAKIRDYYFSL